MWLLLVAAGSGYLARRWHHAEKARHARLDDSTQTKSEEPIKRFPAPLAGNTPPNSPATRVPRSKSLPARVFAKKLRDVVAPGGSVKEKHPDGVLPAVNHGETAGKDREDLANSNRGLSNKERKERLSTLRSTLSNDESTVDRSFSLPDIPLHSPEASVEATLVSESGTYLVLKSPESPAEQVEKLVLCSQSEDICEVQNPDAKLLEETSSKIVALTSGSHAIACCTPEVSEILQVAKAENGSADCLGNPGNFVSKEDLIVPKGAGSSSTGDSQNDTELLTSFQFQAQRIFRKPKLLKLPRVDSVDQISENKGRVSLAYLAGKRLGDRLKNSGFDSLEDTRVCYSRDSWPKRTKDSEDTESIRNTHSSSFARGFVAQSDCHLNLNISGPYGHMRRGTSQRGYSWKLRTPNKMCKFKPIARRLRDIRASHKPLSSFECCLKAQLLDNLDGNEEHSVNRPLDFSSVVREIGQCLEGFRLDSMVGGGKIKDDYSDRDFHIDVLQRNRELSLDVELPQRPKETAAIGKKRKITHMRELLFLAADQGPEICTSEVVAMTPVVGLMFSFGLGVGVLSANTSHRREVDELQHSLKESKSEVQVLRRILQQHGLPVPVFNQLASAGNRGADRKSTAGITQGVEYEQSSDDYASLRVAVTEGASSLQGDQMADLEAELEAELEHLTGQFTDFDELELDDVAAVVHGDLSVRGLPAQVDSDEDDNSAPEVASINNYAVSPRELTRLLRKLQATRQEEQISELEEDLETALLQLQTRENELNLWKERVRRLTELSMSSPIQGEENALLSTPSSDIITPFEQSSPASDTGAEHKSSMHVGPFLGRQESFRFPLLSTTSAGKVLEKDSTESRQIVEKDATDFEDHNSFEKVESRLVRNASLREPSRELFKQEDCFPVEGILVLGDMRENSWMTDDVCDEFLRSMEDSTVNVSPQQDQAIQLVTDCKTVIEDSQIEQLLMDSAQDLGSLEFAESSVMGSNTPSVFDYLSAISMSEGWDVGPEHDKTGHLPQKVSKYPDMNKGMSYVRPSEISMSVSELSDGDENSRSGTTPQVKHVDSRTRTPGDQSLIPFFWNRDGGGLGRAGANTPIDSCFTSNQSTTNTQVASNEQDEVKMDRQRVDLNPTVYDKIVGWEGLIRREPSTNLRSDWECHSQVSKSGRHPGTRFANGDPLCEESLALEAEEYLGNVLINQIAERSRQEAGRTTSTQETAVKVSRGKHVARVSPAAREPRRLKSKDGKRAEEEEYELLRRNLPTRFEAVRVSDDAEYERAIFFGRGNSEESIPEFDHGLVSEEGSVSKFSAREEYGQSILDAGRKGVGRWSLHKPSHQNSPIQSGKPAVAARRQQHL